ncbi:MAG: polymer-forming cytoskeletal protein [Alphaproteobacteria bacterium]
MPEAPGSTKDAPPSLISANLQIVGNLRSQGEVQIDGTVDGDVAANALTIGERATINGEIVADDVVVKGRVNGRIRARKVQLAKSAHVVGDIWHELLAIDSGAFVEGHCKRTDKPTEMSEARIKPVAQPKREMGAGPAPAAATA